LYELFILGELMEQPMHGYLLHHVLSSTLGPLRPISWGTLYPVLRRMEENSWIQQSLDASSSRSGRQRKVYEITPSGEQEFHRLMRKPFEHNDQTEDLFRVKMGNFLHIPRPLQLDIVRQYKTFLEVLADGIEDIAHRVQDNVGVSDDERPHILNVVDYEATAVRAKLMWVEKYLENLEHDGENREK
jgi:DNA-binding PadR family transcriptional regulator